jgi:hypothetical protein
VLRQRPEHGDGLGDEVDLLVELGLVDDPAVLHRLGIVDGDVVEQVQDRGGRRARRGPRRRRAATTSVNASTLRPRWLGMRGEVYLTRHVKST